MPHCLFSRKTALVAATAVCLATPALAPARAAPPDDGATAVDEPEPPPASFSTSSAFRAAWFADNRNGRADDDHFGVGVARSTLALDGGDTRFSVRIDGEAFVSEPAGARRIDELRLERVALELGRQLDLGGRTLEVAVAVGDFYAQLGRGLALSLRRIDELGVDLAARGLRSDVRWGEHLGLTLLGGVTNTVNLEQQFLEHVDEPRDRLGGARLEGTWLDLSLGGHLVGVRDAPSAVVEGPRQTLVFGATLDGVLGPAAFGLEVDGQRRESFGAKDSGWAAYAVGSVPLGNRLTVLAEAKHYVRFAAVSGSSLSTDEGRFIYNQAPTAERIDQEVLDNTDVTGGRLRADLRVGEASAVHASGGLFRNRALAQWVAHGFGGFDWRSAGGSALLLTGGYRREWFVDSGALFRAIAHGELDAILPVSPWVSLHAIGRHESHAEAVGQGGRFVFHRGGASLEADFFERLVAGGGIDWDTQNRSPGVARTFGFGLLRWRQSDAFVLQLLAGSQRGGLRCIAGACRLQPAFTGIRADVTVLF